jgi:hemoglobin
MFASLRAWLIVPCLVVCVLPARADDPMPALSRAELDARLENILYNALVLGVNLFNSNDQGGCYRVYQTSLMSVEPLLDHRPKLREAIRAEMKKAEGQANVADRAFTLRKIIDQAREELKPSKAGMTKSLWERLGGESAVRAVVKEMITLAAPDPKVNFTRNGRFQPKPEDIARIEERLVELISQVSGGPLKYTGKNMKDAHMGMGITDDEFNALAGHLIAVLKKFNVNQKDADELVGIIATTRKDIVEKGSGEMAKKTLWERLGGEPAVRAVVKEFIVVAAPDPKVNFTRNGKFQPKPEDIARIEQRLVELISDVTGGPLKYTGKNMKDAHRGMGITDDEFNAAAGHLIDVLKKFKVNPKDADDLVAIIASTRKDIVEGMGGGSAKKTLWERLGGEPAVTAVIDDFVGRAASNPKVNFTRKGTPNEWQATPENVALLKKRLVQFVSMASGGPLKYQGQSMKNAHTGMKITNAEFDALAADLKASLDKFKVPDDLQQELLQAVGSTRKDIVEEK